MKNYSYIQQVIGPDKGRALLHFKQKDLNERWSSQSQATANADL